MTLYQKTIAKAGVLSGLGLHTGQTARVTVKPAAVNTGIRFFKSGQPVERITNTSFRCTSIGLKERSLLTVEHILAAVHGLEIANLEIHVDGPEIPGFDGSAVHFVKFLKELGIVDQADTRFVYKIKEPLFVGESGRAMAIYPADRFSIAYTLDYDFPGLREQTVDFVITPENFETQIAPARTFCTETDALEIKKKGLGLGADKTNTLVMSPNGPLDNTLRFNDECARHKVLDILGDLALVGFFIQGRVVGVRSGHSLNAKLAEKIRTEAIAKEPHHTARRV